MNGRELALLGFGVGLASFLAAYATRWIAWRVEAIDRPSGGRKIHQKTTPLLGGLGIGLVIFLFCAYGLFQGWFTSVDIHPQQIWGFLFALGMLLTIGIIDDIYHLPPLFRFSLYAFAALIVIFSGTGIHQITHYRGNGSISLDWWTGTLTLFHLKIVLSFPGSFLTFFWLVSVTIATKIMDGLDGLVTGQTIIGAGLIGALTLSTAFFQPSVTVLALLILMAFVGFLPWNIHPARQFLGESGSVIAGFSLGFLSIVSGAKVATALMALGLPLVDVGIVAMGRILRGVSPWQGDKTHLHFRLLERGLSQRQAVAILWLIALIFGVAALTLQTRGKVLLLIGLVGVTLLLSIFPRPPFSTRMKWVVSVSFLFVSLLFLYGYLTRAQSMTQKTSIPTKQISFNGKTITIEIANTEALRQQGLSDRLSLPEDRGMLFLFERPVRHAFWMPRMHFPIDILFLRSCAVVDLVKNLPAPKAGETPARYQPTVDYDQALELPAGMIDRLTSFSVSGTIPPFINLCLP